jgi:peptidoglycan L-alanyl-D-glutamate endopeptidase CwlK
MAYVLGKSSEARLKGVDERLVKLVRRAIEISEVDFTVFEGLRTRARQKQLFEQGVSRTLDSYHLTGHAVDLVPWIAGRAQWQAPACVKVAEAMQHAASELSLNCTWGAVWDTGLLSLSLDLESEVEQYVSRYRSIRGATARPLIDYPHFQVSR